MTILEVVKNDIAMDNFKIKMRLSEAYRINAKGTSRARQASKELEPMVVRPDEQTHPAVSPAVPRNADPCP